MTKKYEIVNPSVLGHMNIRLKRNPSPTLNKILIIKI